MKSQFPYLVDLSLTNQCPLINLCSVGDKCYASPVHKTNELTSWSYFEQVARAMFNGNVLEVAIGGYSEPTTATLYSEYYIQQVAKNPDYARYVSKYNLADVCEYLKRFHFNVGWTTRNYNLDKIPFLRHLLKNTDSIAFSASNLLDLQNVVECIKRVNELEDIKKISIWDVKPTVQLILEILPFDEFKEFVRICTKEYWLPITLLGYKDFGYGKNKKPYQYGTEWIDFMQSLDIYNGFGVDSQIVKDWGDELKSRGVENYRLVAEEGSQTCFIDLQRRVMKPSSFTDVEFDLSDASKLIEKFQKF